MKKLIVAVDFSDASVNAAHYALNMASVIHASLILYHVTDAGLLVTEASLASGIFPQPGANALDKLNQLKKQLIEITDGKVPVSVLHATGTILTELEKTCSEAKPFAVVMGAQGRSALSRTLLGSVTNDAVKHLSYPVLVIPSDARYRGIKQIALACDMESNASILPLATIDELVNVFHAHLDVVHVSQSNDTVKVNVLTESTSIENRLLTYKPSFFYINNTDTEAGLNNFVREQHIDLLLLIPKMRHALAALFHKSLSKRITWHPAIPVMTVHF